MTDLLWGEWRNHPVGDPFRQTRRAAAIVIVMRQLRVPARGSIRAGLGWVLTQRWNFGAVVGFRHCTGSRFRPFPGCASQNLTACRRRRGQAFLFGASALQLALKLFDVLVGRGVGLVFVGVRIG